MARLAVIYDFHDDGLKPFTLVLHFDAGEPDWSTPIHYIPLDAPFKRLMADELEDMGIAVSVLLEDITRSPLHPQSFGIDLKSMERRHKGLHLPLYEVERFIIRLCDVEEVLQSELREHYKY